jgi:hypothetical protein
MAEDEKPSLHIDTDWKKQAQEEKRRLQEEEQKRAAERASAPQGGIGAAAMSGAASGAGPGGGAAGAGAGGAGVGSSEAGGRGRGEAIGAGGRAAPEANISALINSLATQSLLSLGVVAPRGVEPEVNLDMAKFNIDLLGVLEEKTRGNLSADEQKLLDNVLYEVRSRYVAVASQYATV